MEGGAIGSRLWERVSQGLKDRLGTEQREADKTIGNSGNVEGKGGDIN